MPAVDVEIKSSMVQVWAFPRRTSWNRGYDLAINVLLTCSLPTDRSVCPTGFALQEAAEPRASLGRRQRRLRRVRRTLPDNPLHPVQKRPMFL